MEEVLLYLSLIIVISVAFALISRWLKQPPTIAYLLAGVFVGPLFLNLIGTSTESAGMVQSFSRIGVAFLLFLVGLNLNFKTIKETGKVSIISGVFEVILITLLGFFFSVSLGFNNLTSLYIGIAISFSSTVVVVKLLADKKEINTLHGKISLGILIVQDIIASLALMILPLITSKSESYLIFQKFGLAVLVIAGVFLSYKYLFNKLMDKLADSHETLFLFGIAWALALSTLFSKLGFSMEIGALIAGMSLASSRYVLELEGKMKPLRDFFVVLFFVFFGSQLTEVNWFVLQKAILLSIFVLIIKPLTVMFSLKYFNYTKKTNFLTSLSLAQVSEFSLILIMLGLSFGHIDKSIVNLSVLVALITLAISTFAMNHAHKLHEKLNFILRFFDSKKTEEDYKERKYEIFLFGYHRIGFRLFEALKKFGNKLVVLDYNPKVILNLAKKNINCIYGEAGNKELLNDIGLEKAKLVISTVPDVNANMMISKTLKELHSEAVFIATAEQPRTALELYQAGIDYVIIPHHLGGDYAVDLIKEFGLDKNKYEKIGEEHKKSLEKSKKNSNF